MASEGHSTTGPRRPQRATETSPYSSHSVTNRALAWMCTAS
jgi:hypothetical protein